MWLRTSCLRLGNLILGRGPIEHSVDPPALEARSGDFAPGQDLHPGKEPKGHQLNSGRDQQRAEGQWRRPADGDCRRA